MVTLKCVSVQMQNSMHINDCCQTLMFADDISVTSWSSYLYHFVVTGLRQYAVSAQQT